MIKIIFFDGDGTLWYPKATKHTQKPHLIYKTLTASGDHNEHLILTPSVKSTLRILRKMGIITVVISTHPHPVKIANALLKNKIDHFELEHLLDEARTSRNVIHGKGDVITRILKRRGLPKSSALMVGDSYRWDYLAAKKVGVKSLIMDTSYLKEYAKMYPGAGRIKNKIKTIREVLDYV